MLLWLFNNRFYTTLIVGIFFSFAGSALYQSKRQLRLAKTVGRTVSTTHRFLLILINSVLVGIGLVAFVLALYADYMAQGTIFNTWALAFVTGTILFGLLYSAIPGTAQWLDQRIRKKP